MAVQRADRVSASGDIFVRGDDCPPFFADSITLTAAATRAVLLMAGYPLTGVNGTAAASLVTAQKMVYQQVTLQPGVPTKVAVIDAKSGTGPGNFAGIIVNASRLPLSFVSFSTGAVVTPTLGIDTWRTMLTRLNIEFFEESIRADNQPA